MRGTALIYKTQASSGYWVHLILNCSSLKKYWLGARPRSRVSGVSGAKHHNLSKALKKAV